MQVDIHALALGDNLFGLAQDGQVSQAEKVHLEQPDAGNILHGELSHHRGFAVALACPLQGDIAGERLLGYNHAGGMGAGVAGNPLQPSGGINQVADDLILFIDSPQLVILIQGSLQGHPRPEGHQPGDAVDIAVGHTQRPPHIPQRGSGAQGTEGDNLGDMVLAVSLRDIGYDLITAGVLEVQIYIGHLLALQVKKALEDQLILNRVNLGDAQAAQDDAGGGAAPDPEENLTLLGEGDDVPDNEQVVGKLGLLYYLQLVVEPFFYLRGGVGVVLG
ncbi:hypothetical protein ES703_84032 [subsurface metagenome]